MLVEKDSPLRKIPSSLERHQALSIDAIRFTLEMIDVAYGRLLYILDNIIPNDEATLDSQPMAVTFTDTWSLIDSIYRLRQLIKIMPGVKHKELPELQIFLKKTETVENFRHRMQHLNNDIKKLAALNEPAWGYMSWFVEVHNDGNGMVDGGCNIKRGYSCLMISGSISGLKSFPMTLPPVGSVFKSFSGKNGSISLITLKSTDYELLISDSIESIVNLKNAIESYMTNKYDKLPKARSDAYVFGQIDYPI